MTKAQQRKMVGNVAMEQRVPFVRVIVWKRLPDEKWAQNTMLFILN